MMISLYGAGLQYILELTTGLRCSVAGGRGAAMKGGVTVEDIYYKDEDEENELFGLSCVDGTFAFMRARGNCRTAG